MSCIVCVTPPDAVAAGCPPISGYSVQADVDQGGGADDLGPRPADSLAEAAAVCSTDSRCQGFNSAGWMKASVASSHPSMGICLYAKKPLVASEY